MSEPKRFKRESTFFEHLPNELFVEIFGYLNGVDTIYAFCQLNIRFQNLLHNYVNIFDLKSLSLAKFNFITQQHDIHRWRSLCLSNDNNTPGQIQLFCQLFPPAEYIHQLQSLSALNMTPKYAQEFLFKIQSLNNLVSLSIGRICGMNIPSIELPSLKRMNITSCKDTGWIMNLHNLESIQYNIDSDCYHGDNLILPTKLKRLRIFYKGIRDENSVQTLLQQMSQLTILALYNNENYSSIPDGNVWENLIVSSIPLLHTFQFYFPFNNYTASSDDLNQSLASFSTPFYLLEKRWFIRFDYEQKHSFMGAIYSLPFSFSQMPLNTCSFSSSTSTLPDIDCNETKSNYYKNIKTLIFYEKCEQPHLGFLGLNIHHLILEVNLPNSWLYLFNQLQDLTIRRTVEISATDFLRLLERTPNLKSLSLSPNQLEKLTEKFTHNIVCQQLSQRIQSLTITDRYHNTRSLGIVTVRSLHSIARVFSNKCRHLSFASIAQPKTVCPILRRMRELRSLRIQLGFGFIADDDLVQLWFQYQRPTDSMRSDFVHSNDDGDLFVWFGNRF